MRKAGEVREKLKEFYMMKYKQQEEQNSSFLRNQSQCSSSLEPPAVSASQ